MRTHGPVIVVVLLLVTALRGASAAAADTAEWVATTTSGMEMIRLSIGRPPAERPGTLVTDIIQQSDACHAAFTKRYEEPRFNVIGEGDAFFARLYTEQVSLVKAMVAHETVCFEALYKTWKKPTEIPSVEAYVERLKKRKKQIDQIEFEMSGFDPDLAYALFLYRTMLHSLTVEPGHLERWRGSP